MLALFIATLSIGNFFIPAERALDRHVLGQDFLAFYTAGTFAREKRSDDLYNLDVVAISNIRSPEIRSWSLAMRLARSGIRPSMRGFLRRCRI